MMKRLVLFVILNLVCGIVVSNAQIPGANIPTGMWEGVIEDPVRPVVIAADFDSNSAKLDAKGSSSWKIENLSSKDGQVRFQIKVRETLYNFESSLQGSNLRGKVNIGDEQLSFWLERLPILPTPRNRVEGWQQDMDAVTNRFLRYDRSYSAGQRLDFRRRIAKLRGSVGSKTDQEVMVELARIVALGGNAHTRLYLIRNRTEVRRLPIRLWWFKNQLRIVRAAKERAELLGCRIMKIGTMDVERAATKVRGIKAGNGSWQRYMSSYFLTSPDILFGAHVITKPDEVDLRLKCGAASRDVSLTASPLKKGTAAVEAWWDLTIEERDANADFVPAISPEIAPLYLRNTSKNYWFEYIPGSRAIYVQYNRSQESQSGPTMSEFCDSLVSMIKSQRPVALVFDVRFNTGGDLGVGTPLIRRLVAETKNLPVFVLTGRATFSAGITHVVQLKQWAHATIVGEPVGDRLDTWSEGGNLLLPNSKLTVHYGNAFHSYSKKEYPERHPYLDLSVDSVAPDFLIEPSWDDYIHGRDTVLDAALKQIRSLP